MMNRITIVLLLIAISLNARCHDMRMAQFTVHIESGQMICDGRIDKEDFQRAIGEVISDESVGEYLKDHLVFKFNTDEVPFLLESYELKKNIIVVRFSLNTDVHNPTDVEVLNTILSEDIDGHDNIMRFVLHDKTRTFRLNEDRQSVRFNY